MFDNSNDKPNQEQPQKLPTIYDNPQIDLAALHARVDELAKRASYHKGLFIVMQGNEWLEQASKRPIPTMLFSEYWHEGELCILFADTNVGKSILAVQIADSISTGKAIPGFKLEAQAQPVVYFDFELFDKQFEARYSINYTHHYHFDKHFYRAEINPETEVPDHFDDFEEYLHFSLEKTIQETGAKVLVIDNLTYLKNETERAKDALPLMKQLKALKARYGLSILALAHTPKRDLCKPMTRNDLQGSKMLINFCDSSFCIGESQGDKSIRYLKQIKARATEIKYDTENVLLCRIEKPHNFLQFSTAGVSSEREHLKTAEEGEREFLVQRAKDLYNDEGYTQKEIAEMLGIGAATVNRYINS